MPGSIGGSAGFGGLGGGVNLGTVYASVDLRLDRLERAVKQAEGQFKGLEQSVKKSAQNIAAPLQDIGRILTLSVTAPLAALGVAAATTAMKFDGLKRGLIAVEGSAAEAERAIKRLNEVAKLPGLGLEEAQEAYIRLRAVKMSGDDAIKMLTAFGNALATVGKGKNELNGVNNQITQMLSKGKVMMQDVRIIQEYVPQLSDAMQRAFGTRNLDAIEKMGIASEEFIRKVTVELGKLPSVGNTVQNSFENLQDTVKKALLEIGDAILPTVSAIMDKLGPAISNLTQRFKELPDWAKQGSLALGGFAAAAPAVVFALGTLIGSIGNLRKAILALGATSVGAALAGVAKPLLIIAGAVAAVGALSAYLEKIAADARKLYLPGQEPWWARQPGAPDTRFMYAPGSTLGALPTNAPAGLPSALNVRGFNAPAGAALFPGGAVRMPQRGPINLLGMFGARPAAGAARPGPTKPAPFTEEEKQQLRQMHADIVRMTQGEFAGQRASAYNTLQDVLAGKPRAEIAAEARKQYQARMAEINRDENKRIKEELDKRLKIYQGYEDDLIEMLERGDNTWHLNEIRRLEDASEALKQFRSMETAQFGLGGAMGTLRYLRGGGTAGESIQAREARMRRISVPSGGLGAGLNDAFANMRLLQAVPNLTAPLAGMDAALKQVFDQMPRRFSMDSRISRFKETLARSFDFIPDLFSNLADEAYGAFAGTLNKMFGNNPLGRALARTVDRWMSGMLDQALASVFTPSKRGGKMGIMGGEGFPSAGGIPGGIGTVLGGGLGAVFGGPIGAILGGALGGIFRFQEGGRVPGPVGYPRMAVVHGGEFVVSNRMQAAGATVGGGVSVNIGTVHMASDMDVSRTARQIAWQVRRELRTEISR